MLVQCCMSYYSVVSPSCLLLEQRYRHSFNLCNTVDRYSYWVSCTLPLFLLARQNDYWGRHSIQCNEVLVKVTFCCHWISALQVFSRVDSTLNKRTFRECIDAIVKTFPDEDVFESLIDFLTKSVEVSEFSVSMSVHVAMSSFHPLGKCWYVEET